MTRKQSIKLLLSLAIAAVLVFATPSNRAFAQSNPLLDLASLSRGELVSPMSEVDGPGIKRYVTLPGYSGHMVVVVRRPNIIRTRYLAAPGSVEHFCYLANVGAMLKSSPGTKVVFPQNFTFNIRKPTTCTASESKHWDLTKLRDTEINFNGSTLIFHENKPGISFGSSSRVRVTNGTIKYGYQTTSIARVDKKDGRFVFKPLPRWLGGIKNGIYSQTVDTVGLVRVTNPGAPRHSFRISADEQFRSMFPNKGVYRWDWRNELFYPTTSVDFKFKERDLVYIAHVANGGRAIALVGSTDIEIESMKFHNIQGIVIGGYIRRGLRVAGSVINPDPANPVSQFGTTAAGIHLAGLEGDVIIENNVIESTGDDAINIHGGMWRIQNIERYYNTSVIDVVPPDKKKFKNRLATKGEPFAFIGGRFNYKAKSNALIDSVVLRSGDNPLIRLFFNTRLPENVYVNDYVANTQNAGRRVIISSNKIQYVRPRGIMARTSGTYIVNNEVYNTTDSGIRVGMEMRHWYEGVLPIHVKIVRNRLANNARAESARRFGHRPLEVLYLQDGGHPIRNNTAGERVKNRLQQYFEIR